MQPNLSSSGLGLIKWGSLASGELLAVDVVMMAAPGSFQSWPSTVFLRSASTPLEGKVINDTMRRLAGSKIFFWMFVWYSCKLKNRNSYFFFYLRFPENAHWHSLRANLREKSKILEPTVSKLKQNPPELELWFYISIHYGRFLKEGFANICLGLVFDSATLQSTQCIITAPYNQHSLQSTPLFTAWFNHQIWGQYMCGAPEPCRRSVPSHLLL
jgi:hypothetical protein